MLSGVIWVTVSISSTRPWQLTSLSIPVHQGRLALGTWQGIFLFEHRDRPHRRTVVLHALGEPGD